MCSYHATFVVEKCGYCGCSDKCGKCIKSNHTKAGKQQLVCSKCYTNIEKGRICAECPSHTLITCSNCKQGFCGKHARHKFPHCYWCNKKVGCKLCMPKFYRKVGSVSICRGCRNKVNSGKNCSLCFKISVYLCLGCKRGLCEDHSYCVKSCNFCAKKTDFCNECTSTTSIRGHKIDACGACFSELKQRG
jgi:hypothetical protein